MRKQGWVVMVGVLLLAAGAQASVGWAQNFTVGAINQVDWLGGVGSAAAMNKASFDQRQQFFNGHSSLGAFQRASGTIFQNGAASGPIGVSMSRQDANLKGDQSLWASGGRFPESHGVQSMEGALTNSVVKPDGIGKVDGMQHFVGSQEQGVTTAFGSGTQSQYAEVLQRGSISTGANTDPTVTNTVNLKLNQSQITGGM